MSADDMIRCTKCGRQVEDTKAESIMCRYCGHVFRRMDVIRQDEEELKAKMLVELTYTMKLFKTFRNIAIGAGIALIVLSVAFLFAAEVTPIPFMLMGLFIVGGVVWIIIGAVFAKKYADSHSKQFDLTEGRKLLQ